MGKSFKILMGSTAPTLVALGVAIMGTTVPIAAQQAPSITVAPDVPDELNPPFVAGPPSSGGAPTATPEQAAAFAWQEFIALNWPAGPQNGQTGQRDTPSTTCLFGDPSDDCALLTWETFRSKVETFPGTGAPPGYAGSSAATSWGYDATPVYNYAVSIPACASAQDGNATPWINLDETNEITLANMYAGIVEDASSPGNSDPQLVRFLAKSNRSQYVYVAGNSDPMNALDQWWSAIPPSIVQATKDYLAQNQASPPPNSSDVVSLPDGTIEVKAGWRPLNPDEMSSGRFHTQTVRFYEGSPFSPCYHDATWGLVALHIIQKTPSAPYFIYATFEQADNILTAGGERVEDEDGNIILDPEPATATTPQVCLQDPQPPVSSTAPDAPSVSGTVILTDDPTTCLPAKAAAYCTAPGKQIFYLNDLFPPTNNQPAGGNICVNKRDFAIPDYAITANKDAHTAIAAYLSANGLTTAPWLAYKLVNVQYFPYDKIPDPNIPNGSPYTADPPYTATNPAPSSYYQANIMVETNRSLQIFSGGLSPNISTQWNQDGSPHKNTYYGGSFHNMGGCMGCHGSQGQNPGHQAGDFSVILARGAVTFPEVPAAPMGGEVGGLIDVPRNRLLVQ